MPDHSADTPNSPGAWLAHGLALEAGGRFDDAIAAYDRAVALLDGATHGLATEPRRLLGIV